METWVYWVAGAVVVAVAVGVFAMIRKRRKRDEGDPGNDIYPLW